MPKESIKRIINKWVDEHDGGKVKKHIRAYSYRGYEIKKTQKSFSGIVGFNGQPLGTYNYWYSDTFKDGRTFSNLNKIAEAIDEHLADLDDITVKIVEANEVLDLSEKLGEIYKKIPNMELKMKLIDAKITLQNLAHEVVLHGHERG